MTKTTVGALAARANLDHEQTLVALWGGGIEYVKSPGSVIEAKDIRTAERVIGIPGAQQRKVSYWLTEYGVSRTEFGELLAELGFHLRPEAISMPKGSVRRINTYLKSTTETKARTLEQRREDLKVEAKVPAAPFEWVPKGVLRGSQLLTTEEVKGIHEELERDFAEAEDPISPSGVRSIALLESAVSRPATSLGGQYKYCTVESAGAALLHSLVQNHAFHNGNKRTALVALLVFLDRNNFVLESNEDELFKWMILVASHQLLPTGFTYDQRADRETSEIADWIIKRSRPVSKEERSITWRNLSRLLKSKGCEISQHRGEKLEITRTVTRRSRILGFLKTHKLNAYFTNTGDGREVPRTIVKRIRQELELDQEHGVDSEQFYSDGREPDYFILEYSKLLKRLAKV
ncbi:type II toxin-antitoxin system death-on-curing family toxin [Arthrobacter sp. R3-55]